MENARAHEIASRLAQSKKYKHLCPETLRRISLRAAARHRSAKEAEKAARRKLHQIYAAYITPGEAKKIETLSDEFPSTTDSASIKDFCLKVLRCHASSRERIPLLPSFYRDIKKLTGEPGSVLDLSCGLNPFTLPWLSLGPEASYQCIDIDSRLIELIDRFFSRLPGNTSAAWSDILASPPLDRVDMILLLKTLPCLEQQESDASLRLLQSLNAQNIVVSFPARSLGGRDRGMTEHYDRFMSKLIRRLGVEVETLSYPNERVYILKKA